jgi:AAA15 family ATPase/GTPase
VVQNQTISLSLLSTTISNNSSRVSITHEISNEQLIKDSLQWVFEENFENFSQIQIDRDLPSIITQKSGFNSINVDFNPELLQTVDYSKNKIYNYGKVYSFKRIINLPPKTAVDVNAYIDQVINLEIPFEAVAEITAKKSTVDLNGSEIVNIISNSGSVSPIHSVNNKTVIINIRGKLIATFGLRSHFNVIDV